MLNNTWNKQSTSADDLLKVCSSLKSLGWVYVGNDGKIKKICSAIPKILGYEEKELTGASFDLLFSAKEREMELPRAHAVLALNEGEYQAIAHWTHKKGYSKSVVLIYKMLSETAASEIPANSSMIVVVCELPQFMEMEMRLKEFQTRI